MFFISLFLGDFFSIRHFLWSSNVNSSMNKCKIKSTLENHTERHRGTFEEQQASLTSKVGDRDSKMLEDTGRKGFFF